MLLKNIMIISDIHYVSQAPNWSSACSRNIEESQRDRDARKIT